MDTKIKQYSPITKSHLFFYSINSETSKIEFLLYKHNTSSEYSTVHADILPSDNAPTFAICREITNTFFNLFTKSVLAKLYKTEEITAQDVNYSTEAIKPYRLWEQNSYKEYLDKISQNIIQYDDINNEVIYFLEIPYINIDFLNNSLSKISVPFSFIYCGKETIDTIALNADTKRLFDLFPYDKMISHIQSTEETMKNDKCDYYIILACKKQGDDQVGFFHFPALFQGIYRKNTEKWVYLVASTDELPNEELLNKAKCLIIPGSDLNVYNELDFLRKTEKFLYSLINDILYNNKYPQLKLLGICFGMEIFISALEGKISNMGKGVFERFPADIMIKDDFWNLNFVKKSCVEKTKSLRLCEAHGDYIDTFPEKYGFIHMGDSKNCKNELLVHPNEKIFMIQGHPEYYPPFNYNRFAPIFLKRMKNDESDESIEKFITNELGNEQSKNVNIHQWRSICYSFMK